MIEKNLTSGNASNGYILGLDLGVGSVGWAKIPFDGGPISDETLQMGVRIFEAGVDGNLDEGKDEPRNAKRRAARQIRRGFWRARRRIVKIFNILKKAGLLPEGETSTPATRQDFLNRLDGELFAAYFPRASRVEAQTFLYSLRARALDEELSLHAVGRAFLHLAVRRGFLSNKKISGSGNEKEKSEDGVVKDAIKELNEEMAATGARTVGEFFASLDPMKVGERVRGRYLGRKQIQAEFDAIWASQARFHPETLTEELRRDVSRAIFYQRPLKSQKGRIGRCEFEKTARRVEKGDPAFQEYRVWQRVLDLRFYDSPNAPERSRALTPEEQDTVAAFLREREQATFSQLRKALGVKEKPDGKDKRSTLWRFNLELDDEKTLLGNKTRARIVEVLTENDVAKSDAEIDLIAREILVFENEEALARRLRKMFPDFDEKTARELSETTLETTRANLSRRAAEKLTAAMKEKRLPVQTVRQELYPDERNELVYDFLPPVLDALGDPRNPVVARALTELRKVVNAAIRKWGKPERIRVELARDLKRGRKERESVFKENRKREKERERIQKSIREICGREARPFEILKWRLWEECGGVCPYTGRAISERQLLGDESPIDVEHIIPFSRSLDDSFANKTLCFAGENREVKRNLTPFECYGKNPERWSEILERVRRFKGDMRDKKLKRFQQTKIDEDFTLRALNDSRYISRLATRYLGALYGAVDGNDGRGVKRIQVSTGGATAWLREEWGLDRILAKDGGRPKKNRDDHRHHAVDALVVALVGPKEVKTLSEAAQAADELGLNRKFLNAGIAAPPTANGENFVDVAARAVDRIVVSHRVDRKVSGALHDETNYGAEEKEGRRAARKPLTQFSAKDVDAIVDPAIRELVRQKWTENGGDAKKFEANPPFLTTSAGRRVPIKKARYWKTVKTIGVGKSARTRRYVAPGNNSHMEVYALLDKNGVEKEWRAEVVSTFEAHRRLREKEPVVRRDFGPGTRFLFSLALREALTLNDGRLLIVRGIAEKQDGSQFIEFKEHNDGRSAQQMRQKGGRVGLALTSSQFKAKGLRKLRVDALGNVFPANE